MDRHIYDRSSSVSHWLWARIIPVSDLVPCGLRYSGTWLGGIGRQTVGLSDSGASCTVEMFPSAVGWSHLIQSAAVNFLVVDPWGQAR